MSGRFCSLIVLGPGAPRPFKFHLSRSGVAILVLAFFVSFLAVIWLGSTYPSSVNDQHRSKLEAENRALRLETSNAVIGIEKLGAKVTELETQSKRIQELVSPSL